MITVFHGDNLVFSRQAFTDEIKKNFKAETIRLYGQNIQPHDLIQALDSKSLFKLKKQIVIEKLFSQRTSKLKNQLINILLTAPFDLPIIIWEPKALTPATQKKLKKAKAVLKIFKTPAVIFKFLDNFKPDNTRNLINFYHQSLKKSAPEAVFYMLHRRIAQLIQAKDDPQTLKGAPWQIGQLKSQSKYFTLKKLLCLHSQLLKLDYQTKTGQSPLPLDKQLDLLLLNL